MSGSGKVPGMVYGCDCIQSTTVSSGEACGGYGMDLEPTDSSAGPVSGILYGELEFTPSEPCTPGSLDVDLRVIGGRLRILVVLELTTGG